MFREVIWCFTILLLKVFLELVLDLFHEEEKFVGMMQLWSQRWRLLLLTPNFQRFKHTCVTHESKWRLHEAFLNGGYFASTLKNQRCRLHEAFFNGGYFASTLLLPSINMDGNHEVKCTSKTFISNSLYIYFSPNNI